MATITQDLNDITKSLNEAVECIYHEALHVIEKVKKPVEAAANAVKTAKQVKKEMDEVVVPQFVNYLEEFESQMNSLFESIQEIINPAYVKKDCVQATPHRTAPPKQSSKIAEPERELEQLAKIYSPKKSKAAVKTPAKHVVSAEPPTHVKTYNAPNAVAKPQETLDEILNQFDSRLKWLGYTSQVEIYDKKGAVAYSSVKNETNKVATTSYFDVLALYNAGLNTKEIKKEAKKNGYFIKNYEDITDKVSEAILSGGNYARQSFNRDVADKLEATGDVLESYVSGKSYSEIIEGFKAKAGGMNISKSTIKRLARSYENETGYQIREDRKQNLANK